MEGSESGCGAGYEPFDRPKREMSCLRRWKGPFWVFTAIRLIKQSAAKNYPGCAGDDHCARSRRIMPSSGMKFKKQNNCGCSLFCPRSGFGAANEMTPSILAEQARVVAKERYLPYLGKGTDEGAGDERAFWEWPPTAISRPS